MNPRMWAHPATRANVETLVARGVELIGPDEGEMAEGEWGVGRMAEPDEIAARVETLLGNVGPLAGKRVLVSAGGTREPIDSVRFVGNRSSGRMGVALAEEARRRGAAVTLLAANLSVPLPVGVEIVSTPTVSDLEREALARADHDVVVMAAAPADYAPSAPRADKRPKDQSVWTLALGPTTDVLRELGARRHEGQVLVGFGADHGAPGLERKRAMLADKNLDLVVYNDVGAEGIGFDSAENAVTIVTREGEREVERSPKQRIAAAILDEVERLLR
jgi:phosphopantothenoylcysteine decarboxylase/phosphopantothenate--cysteine ligase